MPSDSIDASSRTEERELRTADGDSERLLLTALGKDLYRVEESSFVTAAVYRDVIKTSDTRDGSLLFIEIVERSPLVTNTWTLRKEVIESQAVQSILRRIMDEGGNWEQVFGGCLIVHAPPEISREIEEQILAAANDCPDQS